MLLHKQKVWKTVHTLGMGPYFFFSSFLKRFYCLCYMVLPTFPLCPTPSNPTPTPPVSPHTVVRVHGSCIHARGLVPSPSLHHYLSTSSPLATVSLFYVSVPLVLFWLLVYFAHKSPLISEIICYLSFTDWLMSLSIILSSSILAVAKGRSCLFLSAE